MKKDEKEQMIRNPLYEGATPEMVGKALLRNIKKDKKAGRSDPGDREDEGDEKED